MTLRRFDPHRMRKHLGNTFEVTAKIPRDLRDSGDQTATDAFLRRVVRRLSIHPGYLRGEDWEIEVGLLTEYRLDDPDTYVRVAWRDAGCEICRRGPQVYDTMPGWHHDPRCVNYRAIAGPMVMQSAAERRRERERAGRFVLRRRDAS